MIRFLTLLTAMTVASAAHGDFYGGNQLNEACLQSKSFAMGYVSGVVDKANLDEEWGKNNYAKDVPTSAALTQFLVVLKPFCLPKNATVGQITDVSCNYLKNKPEFRHFPAPSIVQNALREAFPCQQR